MAATLHAGERRRRVDPKVAVCVVYVVAMFMNGMDATIVNVALPAIAAEYAVPEHATAPVNVAYLVSLAMCIPVSGWLGDRFGTKRVFLGAFGVFVAASLWCGLAGGLGELTAARIAQGAGAGVVSPVALTMLFRAYPPEQRLRLSRLLVLPTAVAPALGPLLGGFFVDYLDWRWGFFVNLPVGLLGLAFGARYLVEHVESATLRFDVTGFALAVPGVGAVIYALQALPRTGGTSPVPWLVGGVGAVLLVLLVRGQVRRGAPLLNLRLFRDRSFRLASLVLITCVAGFLGTLYGFTLLYQSELGASAWETGLVTVPKALGLMVASQVLAWVDRVFGPRVLVSASMAGAAVSFAAMSTVGAAGLWYAALVQFASGFFVGLASTELQVVAFATISGAATGSASTLFTVQRQIGSAVGVALTAGVLAVAGVGGASGGAPAHPAAYHAAMGMSAVCALIGAALALRFRVGSSGRASAPEHRRSDRSGGPEGGDVDHCAADRTKMYG